MSKRSNGEWLEAIVVWNPGAGSARGAEESLSQLQSRRDIEVVQTKSRDDAIAAVENACQAKIPRVIAAGGDGTVNAAVTALAHWSSNHGDAPELAVLPLGTGNDLARTLGMPLDPGAAIEICLHGQAGPLDVMMLTGANGGPHVVGNMVTAGNTGKYLEVLTDELKQKWGAFCYLRGAVDILEELDVYQLQLAIDDEPPINVDALNLFFANGRTSGGGMTVCSDASLNDGRLDLLVIRDGTGLDLAALTVDYLTSDLRDSELVIYRRCRRAQVTCRSSLPLSADGDPLQSAGFTVEVQPGALKAVQGEGA